MAKLYFLSCNNERIQHETCLCELHIIDVKARKEVIDWAHQNGLAFEMDENNFSMIGLSDGQHYISNNRWMKDDGRFCCVACQLEGVYRSLENG